MELAMINDTIVPIAEARIPAHDRGLFFGDGVYEVVAAAGGRLFGLDRHLRRLEHSLREMDMLGRVDLELIEQRVRRAYAEAQLPDAKVYFHLTRGCALRAHEYDSDWQPNFFLTVGARRRLPFETVTAITHPDWRWKRCDIKSLNLLANVLAQNAARRQGAYEALLVDENHCVLEATANSVLLVRDSVLRTAPLHANILPGITRALLLEWAPAFGLAVREESFTVEEACQADELMLTGTTSEVLGVRQLDGRMIADGRPGPCTRRFRQRLQEAMQQDR
ncbi:MAG: aminotransferase class IV [Sedimentisphaerales bacterium]|nr:aminotransferase class IV [Sedimentisphaerales bacterium]